MLKRHQVLIEDWLVDYVKHLSELYDLSFSEIIRITLCLESLYVTAHIYPKHKSSPNRNTIMKILKETGRGGPRSAEERHKFLSLVYFEARKATEYRIAKEKRFIK